MALSDLLTQALNASQDGANAAADLLGGYYPVPGSLSQLSTSSAPAPGTPNGYQVLDNRDLWQPTDAPAAAGGILLATFVMVPAGQLWLIDRMMVLTNSTTPTNCFVYVGDVASQNLRAGSESGNLDFADDPTGMLVPGSRLLTVRWVGASLGATGGCGIQYRVMG